MQKIFSLLVAILLFPVSVTAQERFAPSAEPHEGYCITIRNLAFGFDSQNRLTEPRSIIVNNIPGDTIRNLLIIGSVFDKKDRSMPIFWCGSQSGLKGDLRLSKNLFICGTDSDIAIPPSQELTLKGSSYLCWLQSREVKFVRISEFYVTYSSGKVYRLKGFPKNAPVRMLEN